MRAALVSRFLNYRGSRTHTQAGRVVIISVSRWEGFSRETEGSHASPIPGRVIRSWRVDISKNLTSDFENPRIRGRSTTANRFTFIREPVASFDSSPAAGTRFFIVRSCGNPLTRLPKRRRISYVCQLKPITCCLIMRQRLAKITIYSRPSVSRRER